MPRKSQRQKRPAPEAPPQVTRRKSNRTKHHQTSATNPTDTNDGPVTSSLPAIPQQVFDQLVARVSAEVSKNIAPLLAQAIQPSTQSSQLSTQPLALPSGQPLNDEELTELPIGTNTTAASSQSTTTTVSNSINLVNNSLTGEEWHSSSPSQVFQSVGLSLASRIAVKLKSKILANEYIDFGLLLTNPITESKYQLNVVSRGADHPTLCLEAASKPKCIINIDTWMSAFRMFVVVYTQERPTDAPALMKYGEIIQDLASRGQNWKFYDENFRFLRQSNPTLYPWGNIQRELWLQAQAQVSVNKQSLPANNVLPAKTNKQGQIPKGFCYRFHKGKNCPGCDYKHTCFKCEGNHSIFQCNFRPPTKHTRTSSYTKQSKPQPPNPSKG